MSCPIFREDLEKYDLNLFQEHIYVPNERTLWSSPTATLSYHAREDADLRSVNSWGGVAAVFQSALKLKYRQDFSGPDLMVLQLNRLLIYDLAMGRSSREGSL